MAGFKRSLTIRQARGFGVNVQERHIQFPERSVVLATGTLERLLNVPILFDCLAELRLAKIPNSEFLSLSPREQREFLADAIGRITPPVANAPTVCHLDTGVQFGHPLLSIAIKPEHCLYVDPHDASVDVDGHGTEMAGLSLYGCLSELLNSDQDHQLQHSLESVKIFSKHKSNLPDLHGEITSQAVSRIEIAHVHLQRAFCLTVTAADGRDEGFPSSWSAAIDQICSGAEDDDAPKRLFFISAGNVELSDRHEYPDRNQTEGIKDPAQSWNAIAVGAATWKLNNSDPATQHWKVIASQGSLSPASRTSIIWDDKSWPLKPEIVMEGGNNVIDPSTSRADFVDDLSLLTTRVSPFGAQLTTTGDTSAATALAARLAAKIWAEYPDIWPESVRALLIHSARWTDAMLSEFPRPVDRQNRLRCYGYGAPDVKRALSSMSNAATLVVQETLTPFHQNESNTIKTKDLHLHSLPWPKQVLQNLGEAPVRMRVTLSYFIEPSPGRRGWDRKHRYQSHGLRFDVKRPLEMLDEFRKRISKAAQDEDEEISAGSDERNWELGRNLQKKGSIHSDTWIGTAAELAECGVLAVFPVTGWWKERKHLNGWTKQARYSLIISIETDDVTTDLYTPIEQQIRVAVESLIEV